MGLIQTSVIAIILIGVLYLASFWISVAASSSVSGERMSAYECGFEPLGDARAKFEIIYYIIGLLYIVLDLELIFLAPLAVILPTLDSFVMFLIANVFIILITVSFCYEYMSGVLELTE